VRPSSGLAGSRRSPISEIGPFFAHRSQLGSECARLIRSLVPVATPNPTALDAVLARLVLAEPDLANDLLAQGLAIAPSDWMVEPVPARQRGSRKEPRD
jgi:hypothetical protein